MSDGPDLGRMNEDIAPHQFRVVVAGRWGTMLPQLVEAHSLREALRRAAELPLTAWFPIDDEEPQP